MYANCNSNSGYARSDGDIYSALSRAGFKVFSAVMKEFRGFFIKFDETTITLVPGTQEYPLPVDCSQIVHLAERQSATNDWRPIAPLDLDSTLTNIQVASGWSSFFSSQYGYGSEFGFYGPYLDAAATIGAAQTQKIRISPGIDSNRFCQIAYTAKWIPINDQSSKVMLPDEGTYAMESFASAQLCGESDDVTRLGFYGSQAREDLQAFLSWARARQIMAPVMVNAYLDGR